MSKQETYIMTSGRLAREDQTIVFTPIDEEGNEGKKKFLPITNLSSIYVLCNNLEANNSLYMFLSRHEISVHFFDYYSNYAGSFCPKEKYQSGFVHIQQSEFYLDHEKRMTIAKQFVLGAIHNMRVVLKYYENRKENFDSSIIEKLEYFLEEVPKATNIQTLMGLEGNARINYYSAFDYIINDFKFEKRSKQPPHNEVNALISYGNMLLYTACMNAIYASTLNNTISYLHSPGARRNSLALDLSEIFKPFLIDRLIFELFNKKMIQSKHFRKEGNMCMLTDKGKEVFLSAYRDMMKETFTHRSLKKKVSKRFLLVLEARKLMKYVTGIDSEYIPFKAKW